MVEALNNEQIQIARIYTPTSSIRFVNDMLVEETTTELPRRAEMDSRKGRWLTNDTRDVIWSYFNGNFIVHRVALLSKFDRARLLTNRHEIAARKITVHARCFFDFASQAISGIADMDPDFANKFLESYTEKNSQFKRALQFFASLADHIKFSRYTPVLLGTAKCDFLKSLDN